VKCIESDDFFDSLDLARDFESAYGNEGYVPLTTSGLGLVAGTSRDELWDLMPHNPSDGNRKVMVLDAALQQHGSVDVKDKEAVFWRKSASAVRNSELRNFPLTPGPTQQFELLWENKQKSVGFVQKVRTCNWECNSDSDCEAGVEFCNSKKKCQAKLASGEWCAKDNRCASGKCHLLVCECDSTKLPTANGCPGKQLCKYSRWRNSCVECSSQKPCSATHFCADGVCVHNSGNPSGSRCVKDAHCQGSIQCLPYSGLCAGKEVGIGGECRTVKNGPSMCKNGLRCEDDDNVFSCDGDNKHKDQACRCLFDATDRNTQYRDAGGKAFDYCKYDENCQSFSCDTRLNVCRDVNKLEEIGYPCKENNECRTNKCGRYDVCVAKRKGSAEPGNACDKDEQCGTVRFGSGFCGKVTHKCQRSNAADKSECRSHAECKSKRCEYVERTLPCKGKFCQCLPKLAKGADFCKYDKDCESKVCNTVEQKCDPMRRTNGQSCTNTVQCNPGGQCKSKTCVPLSTRPGAPGDVCTADDQCQSLWGRSAMGKCIDSKIFEDVKLRASPTKKRCSKGDRGSPCKGQEHCRKNYEYSNGFDIADLKCLTGICLAVDKNAKLTKKDNFRNSGRIKQGEKCYHELECAFSKDKSDKTPNPRNYDPQTRPNFRCMKCRNERCYQHESTMGICGPGSRKW